MKNLLKLNFIVAVMLTLLLSVSCSSDDDSSPTVMAPTFNLGQAEIDATFFTSGNATPYSTNWNGAQGTYAILGSLEGLNINAATGELSWTNQLPLGTHNVVVVATNSAGSTQQAITINNPFQGLFTGDYGISFYLQLEFNPDGTMSLRSNDAANPDIATGTWTRNGLEIVVDYSYGGSSEFSLRGDLAIDASDVVYSGNWYNFYGAEAGNEGGPFEVELE